MSNRQTVLVLGAGGFIGRHLVQALAEAGIGVIAATRQHCHFDHPLIENVVCSYTEPDSFLALFGRCGAVVHAASASTPGSSATPQIDGNLRTTLALLEALQRASGHRVVYLSSAGTLYGERQLPAAESDPLRPRSYHGAGKAAAEMFLQAWAAQYGGTAVVLRPSNVYGPGQAARRGFAIVPTAMDCALHARPLEIWGDGSQVRDYLHVQDLVTLSMHAIQAPLATGCHIYNAASGQATRLDSLLGMIESVSGKPIQRQYAPARAADIGTVQIDPQQASTVLGWHAKIRLPEGLAQTWAWHRLQQ